MYHNTPNCFSVPMNNVESFEPHATEKGFRELPKQELAAGNMLCEIIDNAVAARKDDEPLQVTVSLASAPDSHYMYVAIADNGRGMSKKRMQEAMDIGTEPISDNPGNEHGMGLPINLPGLTAFGGHWACYSREFGQDGYSVMFGPIRANMDVGSCKEITLPKGISLAMDEPSTVFLFYISTDIMCTLKPNAYLSDINPAKCMWLLYEIIGVAYRPLLRKAPGMPAATKIVLTLSGEEIEVQPLEVPMKNVQEKQFQVEYNGQLVPIVYKFGEFDIKKRKALMPNRQLTKINYKHNMDTQGVDIVVGDRVLMTHQFPTIWRKENGDPLTRHPDYNYFLGEVLIPQLPRGALPTLINKTGIYRNCRLWQAIVDELREYTPLKHSKCSVEDQLKQQWVDKLSSGDCGDIVSREVNVFDDGVRIDVLLENSSNGTCIVYEMKAGRAQPGDAYQLLMYAHGLLKEGKQPTKAVLIAESFPKNIQSQVEFMNKLGVIPNLYGNPNEEPCKIVLATLKEKGLHKHLDED